MPKGGHAASGPPPDPNALRRGRSGDAATWTTLPREGRQGEPPAWPLTEQDGREAELWARLWATPQAVMWERLGQAVEVAMYVRLLAKSEHPRAGVEIQKITRQYMGSLGLTVEGMLRNRWKIEQAAAPAPTSASASAPRRPSSRDRLTVIRGDGES